jgi:hypothetical protein
MRQAVLYSVCYLTVLVLADRRTTLPATLLPATTAKRLPPAICLQARAVTPPRTFTDMLPTHLPHALLLRWVFCHYAYACGARSALVISYASRLGIMEPVFDTCCVTDTRLTCSGKSTGAVLQ